MWSWFKSLPLVFLHWGKILSAWLRLFSLSLLRACFGSAVIIKASLNASLCSFSLSNNCCAIKLPNNVFFFSIYCRPSLPCITSHLASILYVPSWVIIKVATLGIDCNAKNKSWNSGRTNKIGAELEYCFLDHALSISNVDIALLPHKPSNTSFLDVTLEGDSVSLSGWHYPFYPSLSDHPFIMFFVEYDRFFSIVGCQSRPTSFSSVLRYSALTQ